MAAGALQPPALLRSGLELPTCDARGEVFGARGLFIADTSAFPASLGVNPMISVMALTHHTAQGIKAQL